MHEKLKKCNYIYYNANPLGREVNDCSVRAISLAEGSSWDETYDKLSNYAKEKCMLLDEAKFIEPYLNSKYPKVYYRCITCGDKNLGDLLKIYNRGIYLITMKGHITCSINGVVYDTWDCTKNKVWCIWKVR